MCVCVLQEKMLDVYWLLRVCICTIEHADNTGSLFAFNPEFYLNVAMNSYSALKNYFSPANSMDELPGQFSPSLPLSLSHPYSLSLSLSLSLSFSLSLLSLSLSLSLSLQNPEGL